MRSVPYCLRPGQNNELLQIPEILSETVSETAMRVREERQTIVHCHFLASPGSLIRIWRSTFLIPDGINGDRIPLLHAENICYAPEWYRIEGFGIFTFSLIFAGLPSGCIRFDLKEEIDQPGAFFAANILRNESDVYNLIL